MKTDESLDDKKKRKGMNKLIFLDFFSRLWNSLEAQFSIGRRFSISDLKEIEIENVQLFTLLNFA